MSASKVEIEGWKAFYAGIPKENNPYPPGSSEYDDWHFGWERAWRHANGEEY